MKIEKLHIENFGKLQNIDLSFSQGLNEFYKENGWGKSTLITFIKAMFYGMSAKARGDAVNYERTKFMPWQGGKYGGFIELKMDNGERYRITRYFDKTPEGDSVEIVDLQTNKPLAKQKDEFGDMIFGLGKETFEITAFFPQLHFASLANPQITASLTGADKFQNDFENVNNAIKIIDSNNLAVKKSKPKVEDIEYTRRGISEEKLELSMLAKNVEEAKKKLKISQTQLGVLNKIIETERDNYDKKSRFYDDKQALEKEILEKTEILNSQLQESALIKEKCEQNKLAIKQKQRKIRQKNLLIGFPCAVVAISALFVFLMILKSISVGIGVSVIAVMVGAYLILASIISLAMKKQKPIEFIGNAEEENKKITKQIATSQHELEELKNALTNQQDVLAPDRERLDSLENEKHNLNLEIMSSEHEVKSLMHEYDEEVEEIERLQENFEALNDEKIEADRKMNIFAITKKYLLQAQENVSERFVVPINQKFKTMLEKFKLEESGFVIDTSWTAKQNTPFGLKAVGYSSQGLQDIISFCQRINLIEEIYKKEKPLIILDDTFVNLDDAKMEIAKQITLALAEEYQVMYMCCNNRASIKSCNE